MPPLGDEPTPEANRYGVGSTSCLKLREQMSDVGLHCLFRQEQALTDLAVHEPIRNKLENLAFTRCGLLFELAGGRAGERDDRTGAGTATACGCRLEAATVIPIPVQDLLALSGVHVSGIGLGGQPL